MENMHCKQKQTNTTTDLSERENGSVYKTESEAMDICANQEDLMRASSNGDNWMTWKSMEYTPYTQPQSNSSTERENGWVSEVQIKTMGTRQIYEDSMKASSDGESSNDRYMRFDESNYYSDSTSENTHVSRFQALVSLRHDSYKTQKDLRTVGVSNEVHYFGYRFLPRASSNGAEINESLRDSLSSTSNCNEGSVSTASEFSAVQDIIVKFSRMTLEQSSAAKRTRSTSSSSSLSCESKDAQSKRRRL